MLVAIALMSSSCVGTGDSKLTVSFENKTPQDNSNPEGNSSNNNSDNSSGANSGSESDSSSNNSSDNSSQQSPEASSLVFTPKGANAGDAIQLGEFLANLVTVTNNSSSAVSGNLSLAGTDASKLELITVTGLTQNGDGLTYTIAANSTAKFLVVRKESFSSSLSAKIQDDSSGSSVDVANITASSLGYNILYWFTPKDITLSNVNDTDTSGNLSDGDTLNSLPDRSGNNYILNKSSSSGLATYITTGKNGHNNIDMNAYYSGAYYGANYSITTASYLPLTAGDDIIYAVSASLDNTTTRQKFDTYDTALCSAPSSCRGIHGIDFNTHNTAGQKHGAYIAGISYDANLTLSTAPQITMLSMQNTSVGNSILSNTNYYVNNNNYALSTRSTSASSNGGFYSYIEQSQIIRLMFNAKIYESIIVYGDISEAERLNLHCYLALKSDIDSASCM